MGDIPVLLMKPVSAVRDCGATKLSIFPIIDRMLRCRAFRMEPTGRKFGVGEGGSCVDGHSVPPSAPHSLGKFTSD